MGRPTQKTRAGAPIQLTPPRLPIAVRSHGPLPRRALTCLRRSPHAPGSNIELAPLSPGHARVPQIRLVQRRDTLGTPNEGSRG